MVAFNYTPDLCLCSRAERHGQTKVICGSWHSETEGGRERGKRGKRARRGERAKQLDVFVPFSAESGPRHAFVWSAVLASRMARELSVATVYCSMTNLPLPSATEIRTNSPSPASSGAILRQSQHSSSPPPPFPLPELLEKPWRATDGQSGLFCEEDRGHSAKKRSPKHQMQSCLITLTSAPLSVAVVRKAYAASLGLFGIFSLNYFAFLTLRFSWPF